MQVTVDIKELLLCLLIIAGIVAIIYLCITLANAVKTIKKADAILDDVKPLTEMIGENSQELKPAVSDLTSVVKSFSSAAKGNESTVASLSSISKSIASLFSIIKRSR